TTMPEPTLASRSPSTVVTGTLQTARITINATGELEPPTISATAGLTLALTMDNRSENDALLVFDLAPAGTLAFTLPATLAVASTATRATEPTSAATAGSTGTTTGTSTSEPAAAATSTISETSAPTEPLASSAHGTTALVRFDQPGTYQAHCAPS